MFELQNQKGTSKVTAKGASQVVSEVASKIALTLFPLLSLTVGAIAPVGAQTTLPDIAGHWAEDCIQELQTRRIINGYPDSTFRPNAPVTRAEFATMLDIAFSERRDVRPAIDFVDLPANYWATPAIATAYRRGFLRGYPGDRFNPAQSIPRVQVLVALASGLDYAANHKPEETLPRTFADAATIPEYAYTAVAAATERRLAVNYPERDRLNPNALASRAEVASFLCQALMQYQSPIPLEYVARVAIVPETELRGVWITNIDSEVLFSKENLTAAMERLAALNFNTVYPTVWNWGYTLYPSDVAKAVTGRSVRLVTPIDEHLDPDLGAGDRDMLREMVAEGKRLGLRVIPWFEFGFMAPADSELARRKPEWITERLDGTQEKMEGIHSRVWLNPFHPEVQQFITDLIVEIIENYEVAGIQLDDHLGLPSEFGYDDYTVALYKREHDGNPPPEDPKDPDWLRWRADKITEYKDRLFRAIKRANPDAIVSLSPNPQRFSYREFLADWETWERQGLVEEIILQVYRDDNRVYATELENPEVETARTHVPFAIGILTGLKGRPVEGDRIAEQVQIAREKGFAGVSFFFYESMWKWSEQSAEQRQVLFESLFPEPATIPSLVDDWEPSR
ncbi:family 10 glycosylhydrolase [Oxynema sp. CENA135]|nr:family 10 glycosylhydrolase [Oxynema sp. CENA135]